MLTRFIPPPSTMSVDDVVAGHFWEIANLAHLKHRLVQEKGSMTKQNTESGSALSPRRRALCCGTCHFRSMFGSRIMCSADGTHRECNPSGAHRLSDEDLAWAKAHETHDWAVCCQWLPRATKAYVKPQLVIGHEDFAALTPWEQGFVLMANDMASANGKVSVWALAEGIGTELPYENTEDDRTVVFWSFHRQSYFGFSFNSPEERNEAMQGVKDAVNLYGRPGFNSRAGGRPERPPHA